MIRIIPIILPLCLLSSCGDLHLRSASYDAKLEPIYLKSDHSFASSNIVASLSNQLRDLGITISSNSKDANTIIAIESTEHNTSKVTSSSTTSDTTYYNNEYSTMLTVTYPNDKNRNFSHKITANEQITILENQNTFNNHYDSAELENELAERVILAILTKSHAS